VVLATQEEEEEEEYGNSERQRVKLVPTISQ